MRDFETMAIMARWARDALRTRGRVGDCEAEVALAIASLAHLAERIEGPEAGERTLESALALFRKD